MINNLSLRQVGGGEISAVKRQPVIVVSRCLGFGVCRWNGAKLKCQLVEDLQNKVDFIPVCPECEIGLGMPRPPIRLVRKNSAVTLLQPATGLDLTGRMLRFSENFLRSLDRVDAFLLKRKSPSCGLADIPIYSAADANVPLNKNGTGLFARTAAKIFPDIPKIDEESLKEETFLRIIS